MPTIDWTFLFATWEIPGRYPAILDHPEKGKAARELPGIVDQVMTLSLFAKDGDGWRHDPEKGEHRRLVCRSGNPFALPAKDRSGRLDVTEPADLGALLAKINATAKG